MDTRNSQSEIKQIKAQLNQAKKRFADFTGHSVQCLKYQKALSILAQKTGDHVWFHVGQLDYLKLITCEPVKGNLYKCYELKFHTLFDAYEPNTYPLLIKFDGTQFACLLPIKHDLIKETAKFRVGVADVYAIGYTTVRDGKLISYNHDFKEFARPQLDFKTCKHIILSLGGGFEFTDSGFNDKRK